MKGLKHLREKAGLQQKDIAELLGVTSPAVAHWELGTRDPGLRYIMQLKELFGCTYDELITGEVPDENIINNQGGEGNGITLGEHL